MSYAPIITSFAHTAQDDQRSGVQKELGENTLAGSERERLAAALAIAERAMNVAATAASGGLPGTTLDRTLS
ncbi:hypothetical protein [Nonomuraea roseola]|uniref:Uncharacterized protein n=1 Tax=Nonomuraea roseola TaxID=46179 RepID=A0ABV5QDP0_9ACTN